MARRTKRLWTDEEKRSICFQTAAPADFCIEALNQAIHRFGAPGIMSTDQGSQFTSFA